MQIMFKRRFYSFYLSLKDTSREQYVCVNVALCVVLPKVSENFLVIT
jgi:hypothetical protein